MRFSDLISLIIDNLSRRKGRVMLTAIGVVIGTAAVVTLVSLGAGLQASATSNLWGITDLASVQVSPGYPEYQSFVPVSFTEDDIKKITPSVIEQFKAMPGVKQVVIKDYLRGGANLSYDKMEGWGNFQALNITDLKEMGLEASQGTTVPEKGQIVLGSQYKNNFYDPNPKPGEEPRMIDDLFGKTIDVVMVKWDNEGNEAKRTVKFEVVGILKESRSEADWSMYMNYDELTRWNEWFAGKRIDYNKEGYQNVSVRAESPEVVVELADKITEMGFQAYTPQEAVEGINSFFAIMQIVFGGIGAIALLVAAIGIANTMTMAILERTREIGIMKAIGATNNNILAIFLGEAAGIGFLGGVGGVLLGWAPCAVVNALGSSLLASGSGGTQLNAVIPLWLPIFSIAFATVVGLISGLFPSLNAATMVPVDALKYE